MGMLSRDLGFIYADLLPAFTGHNAKSLWSLPGDPHPNSLGHELMAKMLFPVLQTIDAENKKLQ